MRRSTIVQRCIGGAVVALGTLACSSQSAPEVPPPLGTDWADLSSSRTELHDDDIAVTQAAILAFLASSYGVPYNVGHGGVSMVMPDRTIRACPLSERRPGNYECIQTHDQEAMERLLASDYSPSAARLFQDRNAQSSMIPRRIDSQLQLVPSVDLLNMLDGAWGNTFAQRFPGTQGIVIVSAPIYPAAGRAVAYVLHVVHSAAYVDLERQRRSWNVRAIHGLWVS